MSVILELIRRDILIEWRSRESIGVALFISLAAAMLSAVAVNSMFVGPDVVARFYPVIIWVVFLLSSAFVLGRTFEAELSHMGIEGLLVSGVSSRAIFVAKTITNFLLMMIGQLALAIVLALLLDIDLAPIGSGLVIIAAPVIFAYSSIATVVVGMTVNSALRTVLLPILLLPLVFPLFFGAVELSSELSVSGKFFYGSPWFLLELALDLIYFSLGTALYGKVLRG